MTGPASPPSATVYDRLRAELARKPRQTCSLCGNSVVCKPDGRGFPPNIAANRLRKRCNAAGCPCDPQYTAGVAFGGPVTGQATDQNAPSDQHGESS